MRSLSHPCGTTAVSVQTFLNAVLEPEHLSLL